MIAPADLAACQAAIRTGSLSFHAASKLLPGKVRDPALALYAFCRIADDAVDEGHDKAHAVLTLRDRLDLIYEGRPRNAAADRAFASVVEDFDMPRALPEALLEGLAWDAVGRRYDDLSGVLSYSARVAAAVGAMMCVLMRVRNADALARACDLGLAMQLTNIARDVGEDAREGRLFLPQDWLADEGVDPAAFLADPKPNPAIARVTKTCWRRPNACINAQNLVWRHCLSSAAPASLLRATFTAASALPWRAMAMIISPTAPEPVLPANWAGWRYLWPILPPPLCCRNRPFCMQPQRPRWLSLCKPPPARNRTRADLMRFWAFWRN